MPKPVPIEHEEEIRPVVANDSKANVQEDVIPMEVASYILCEKTGIMTDARYDDGFDYICTRCNVGTLKLPSQMIHHLQAQHNGWLQVSHSNLILSFVAQDLVSAFEYVLSSAFKGRVRVPLAINYMGNLSLIRMVI